MPLEAPAARARRWPTDEQELLLRAALGEGPTAVVAWQAWKTRRDLDSVDPDSYQLFPLAYQNLADQYADEPELDRLRGVYRWTWSANQLTLQRTAGLLRLFQDRGIRTLLLGGPALVLRYYPRPGLRPLGELGLLVPIEQARDAIDLLQGQRFNPSPHHWGGFKDVYVRVRPAFPFVDPSGANLDLRWHLYERGSQPGADVHIWAAASAITLHGTTTHLLDPADQLLYLCASASRPGQAPSIQWLVDASMVIRASPHLDWNRLFEQAQRHQLVLPLRAALGYLRRGPGAPNAIPAAVADRLVDLVPSPAERLERQASRRLELTLDPTFWLRVHLQRYRQISPPISAWQQPLGFARFLQYSWCLDRLRAVPGYALKGGLRRIGRTLGRPGTLNLGPWFR